MPTVSATSCGRTQRHARALADERPNGGPNSPAGPFNPGPSWHVKDSGDFNGDGKADILWQNNDGTPAIWLMNGSKPYPRRCRLVQSGAGLAGQGHRRLQRRRQVRHPVAGQRRHAGDLADGRLERAVRRPAGSFNPGPSWQIKATGDFNGDGKSDILWQNNDGTPAIWLMNGINRVSNSAAGPFNPGPTWHIKATGDFNGDSKSDILWQNDDGTPAIWLMNGSTVLANSAVGPFNPGPTGRSRTPATSTATASPTSCGRATTAHPPSG